MHQLVDMMCTSTTSALLVSYEATATTTSYSTSYRVLCVGVCHCGNVIQNIG